MKKIITLCVIALLGLAVFLLIYRSDPPSDPKSDSVRLVIGKSGGYRGSHQNLIDVSLDNPGQKLRGIQLEICDADNFLSCSFNSLCYI